MAMQTNDANFQSDVLNSGTPVVVDFYADWCGPCKMLAPVLDEVSTEMGDKVKIVKLNIDENPQAAAQYGVRSIPTMIMFSSGQAVSSKVGLHPKGSIVGWINENL